MMLAGSNHDFGQQANRCSTQKKLLADGPQIGNLISMPSSGDVFIDFGKLASDASARWPSATIPNAANSMATASFLDTTRLPNVPAGGTMRRDTLRCRWVGRANLIQY